MTGGFEYSHAAGKTSVEDGAAEIKDDAVFLLASQTKLLTAVAALQIVERGLIAFDDNVEELLPELAGQQVLTGFDGDDKPILEARTEAITFRYVGLMLCSIADGCSILTPDPRRLLTHTAGTAYDAGDANLIKYQTQRGVTPNSGPDVVSRFSYPLIFQPGTKWAYGTGMDWAGLVIERLTKSTLEEYMKTNIWDPLGAKTMTFFPQQNAALEVRVPTLSARGPDGNLHPFKGPFITTGVTGCFGGSGGYSSLGDYRSLLLSLLRNDGKLLRPESVDELFKPQLTSAQAQAFKEYLLGPSGAFFIGEFLAEKYAHDWAFGGVVFVEGYKDGRRGAGTLSWGGIANTFWMIDREAGLALTFGTQVIPPGDVKVKEVISVVEREVNRMAGAA